MDANNEKPRTADGLPMTREGAMESPATVPCFDHISEEFERIPPARQRSRSFDNADINLTYSEDVVAQSPVTASAPFLRVAQTNDIRRVPTTGTALPTLPPAAVRVTRSRSIDMTYSEDSPIAALTFVPRNRERGAPPIPIAQPESMRFTHSEGFTMNPSTVLRMEEELRQTVVVDYDVSEEEDSLVADENESLLEEETELGSRMVEEEEESSNRLEISYETAPVNTHSEPLLTRGMPRSVSFSALSPSTLKAAEKDESAVDLAVPSLTPPTRTSSSSLLYQLDARLSGASMPPRGQNLHNAQATMRAKTSLQLPVRSPYALRRQVSLPVTTSERTSPRIVRSDIPKKSIAGRNTPTSRNRDQGASLFREGRLGSVASPGGLRTPSPSKGYRKSLRRDESTERLTLCSPYTLRRPSSVPNVSWERRSPSIRFSDNSRRVTSNQRGWTHGQPKIAPNEGNVGSSRRKGSIGSEESSRCRKESMGIEESSRRRGSIGAEEWPDIKENPTFITDNTDMEMGAQSVHGDEDVGTSQGSIHVENDVTDTLPSDTSTRSKDEKVFFQRQKLPYVLYLSAFSIFGSSIRVFLVRIFGIHCETADPEMDEFCITTSGTTLQRGGALFADLPANIVGCFIMGLITSLQSDLWPPLPWLRPDHPLQQHDAYHVGIRTGLCGSITTFASWNAQMIVMMDGTATLLGSQVVSALSGYIIGFFCAIMSFLIGTHCSMWLTRWRNPELALEDDEIVRLNTVGVMEREGDYMIDDHPEDEFSTARSCPSGSCSSRQPFTNVIVIPRVFTARQSCQGKRFCRGHLLPFVLVACLLLGYAAAGFIMGNAFFRTLFYSSLFTPPGALLRWELAKFNTRFSDSRWRRFRWIPIGSLVANLCGSVVSILLLAIETRYLLATDAEKNLLAISIVTALRAGFAGSLSTVSTMVQEMFQLTVEFPHHAKAYHYALLTVAVSVVLCISIYSPIVRS